MKAKDIVKAFSQLDPEEEICILWYEIPRDEDMYGFLPSKNAWEKICKEFEDTEYMDNEISDWMMDSILQYKDVK
jgi:hypothetical protein